MSPMPDWNLPLPSAMWKKLNFLLLFFTFALHAEENLEVLLSTKADLKPIYVSELHVSEEQVDWRYPEELRTLLIFDLAHNGSSSVPLQRLEWGKKIDRPDPRTRFDTAFWSRENIPFVLAVQATQNSFSATAFHVAKGSS